AFIVLVPRAVPTRRSSDLAASERLAEVMSIAAKTEREERTEQLLGELIDELSAEGAQLEGRDKEVTGAFRALTKQVVRKKVLTEDRKSTRLNSSHVSISYA